jgi:uncharacterized protein (DUF697 family)
VKRRPLKLRPRQLAAAVGEVRRLREADRPLVVTGPRELAEPLRNELTRGGVASAVREHDERPAAIVRVLAGELSPEDERTLRAASRVRLPTVVVLTGPGSATRRVPYVLEERIVRATAGGVPTAALAAALARALAENGTPLAARLPVLRRPVCDALIRRASRQNALIGAAVFIPGADLPVLTLNQVRLVMRIADAHGFEIDRERIPEVVGVIASAVGLRALARQALGLIPAAGWVVKGGIAYLGTRALGEAALRYFERRAPVTRVPGERSVFPR